MEEVTRIPAGENEVVRSKWKSFLPYSLTLYNKITAVQEPFFMDLETWGDLTGTGKWILSEDSEGTEVLIDWQVETTHWLMDMLTPVGKPLFELNHNWLMANGAKGLGKELNTEVLVGTFTEAELENLSKFAQSNWPTAFNQWFGK